MCVFNSLRRYLWTGRHFVMIKQNAGSNDNILWFPPITICTIDEKVNSTKQFIFVYLMQNYNERLGRRTWECCASKWTLFVASAIVVYFNSKLNTYNNNVRKNIALHCILEFPAIFKPTPIEKQTTYTKPCLLEYSQWFSQSLTILNVAISVLPLLLLLQNKRYRNCRVFVHTNIDFLFSLAFVPLSSLYFSLIRLVLAMMMMVRNSIKFRMCMCTFFFLQRLKAWYPRNFP